MSEIITCFSKKYCTTCNKSKPKLSDWYKTVKSRCRSCHKLHCAQNLRDRLSTNPDFRKQRYKETGDAAKLKYHTDPIYRQKIIDQTTAYVSARYKTDPVFRAKMKANASKHNKLSKGE